MHNAYYTQYFIKQSEVLKTAFACGSRVDFGSVLVPKKREEIIICRPHFCGTKNKIKTDYGMSTF